MSAAFDSRTLELILRNVEIARDLGHGAIKSGEAPGDVLDRTLDNVRGFVLGGVALIVPPDMWDEAERDEMIALGQKLAAEHGW